jgi:hypothetical protein
LVLAVLGQMMALVMYMVILEQTPYLALSLLMVVVVEAEDLVQVVRVDKMEALVVVDMFLLPVLLEEMETLRLHHQAKEVMAELELHHLLIMLVEEAVAQVLQEEMVQQVLVPMVELEEMEQFQLFQAHR